MGKKLKFHNTRFDDDQIETVQRAASAAGMTVGQYLRHCALSAAKAAAEAQQITAPQGPPAEAPPAPAPAPAPAAAPARVPSPRGATKPAPLARFKLDAIGADPLRGGQRSARR